MISLIGNSLTSNDYKIMADFCSPDNRLTQGKKTAEFEACFSKYIGTEYCVFVNSGSSAILLMLYSLKIRGLLRSEKIITPALSWVTDVSSVMQLGLTPVLCDCNLKDLSVDLNHLEELFKEHRPAAFVLVSVLGLVPDMKAVVEMCEKYEVILLEDNCESMGSCYGEKKIGNFGLMAAYSTYFGHHITTIEGGLICTNDYEQYCVLKMLRSHGWTRDLSSEDQFSYKQASGCTDFEELYTFYYPGFNLRSTDFQANIGIHQVSKLDWITARRQENFYTYQDNLKKGAWKPEVQEYNTISSFAYPVIDRNKEKMIYELRKNHVEVRPLIAGSMGTQPFWISQYDRKVFKNANLIDSCGFYVPNHPDVSTKDVEFICSIVNKYID